MTSDPVVKDILGASVSYSGSMAPCGYLVVPECVIRVEILRNWQNPPTYFYNL
jgi:hypothetical protein